MDTGKLLTLSFNMSSLERTRDGDGRRDDDGTSSPGSPSQHSRQQRQGVGGWGGNTYLVRHNKLWGTFNTQVTLGAGFHNVGHLIHLCATHPTRASNKQGKRGREMSQQENEKNMWNKVGPPSGEMSHTPSALRRPKIAMISSKAANHKNTS